MIEAGTEHPAFRRALTALQTGRAADAEALFKLVLKEQPQHIATINLLAVLLIRLGRFADAEIYLRRAVGADGRSAATLNNYAIVLRALGRPLEALQPLSDALQINPKDAELWNMRGIVLMDLTRYEEAVRNFDRAVELNGRYAEAFCNKGRSLALIEHWKDACAAFDCALALDSNFVEAGYYRGNALWLLKRYNDALSAFDHALTLKPDYAEAWLGRGNACFELGRPEEALSAYDKALALNPRYAVAHSNRATVLLDLKRLDEASAGFDQSLQLMPDLADAWVGKGGVYFQRSEFDKAAPAYEKALRLDPRLAKAWLGRGNVLTKFNRHRDALEAFARALELDPDLAQAWSGRVETLTQLGRLNEAIAVCNQALALRSDLVNFVGARLNLKLVTCDWSNLHAELTELTDALRPQPAANELPAGDAVRHSSTDNLRIVSPMCLARLTDDPAQLLMSAVDWIRICASYPIPFVPAAASRAGKIRLGYVSADFYKHVTGYGVVEMLERHDRERFELHGFSLTASDGSAIRTRIAVAFDQFHDLSRLGDEAAARHIFNLGIDVLVEMVPLSFGSRPAILGYRPAPIQVNYAPAGFSSGAPFIDYVIGDEWTLPPSDHRYFREKVATIPHSWFAHDSTVAISPQVPSRAEEGLPEQGFVFCCFNNSYKITPEFFAVWMRLLREIDGSVLWLARNNDFAAANLRRAASEAGMDPDRLVFAQKRPAIEDHLARHRLADLFLDTLPYNAQTTATDALWAGLPVLTCAGRSFAGRVAISLLQSLNVPELIAKDLTTYEQLAMALARDPQRLREIRAKVENNRLTAPLFDTNRLCRELEAAYEKMVEIWQRGESPRSFSIAPLS